MVQGILAEVGTHQQLISVEGGVYQHLCNQQTLATE